MEVGGLQGCQYHPRRSDHKFSPGSNDTSGSKSEEDTALSEVDNSQKHQCPVAEWKHSSSKCVLRGADARAGYKDFQLVLCYH